MLLFLLLLLVQLQFAQFNAMSYHLVVPRRALFLGFFLMAALLAGSIAYLYLPQAHIVVSPTTEQRTATQSITLSSERSDPDFVRYALPARIVERTITEEKTFTRSSDVVRDDFARGVVVLHNEADEEQQLLPKTHLRHVQTGVFFLTDSPVAIPPHASVPMQVTAKEPGAAGNVLAGRFIVDKLSPALQDVVYAESDQSFVGGVATDQPLSDDELTHAYDEVAASAQQRALGELVAEAGGASIRDELIQLDVAEQTSSASAGSAPVEFSVRVVVRARGFVVDENDLLSLTLLALRSSARPEEEFVNFDPNSFSVRVAHADPDHGEALVEGSLSGAFAHKVSPTVFRSDNLAGLTDNEVSEYFSQFPTVSKVAVRFSPFWVTTVPARERAVEITVEDTADN